MTDTTSQLDQAKNGQSNDAGSEGRDQAGNGQSKVYEVNGMQLTPEELVERYRNLEKDYTQKTQKLSDLEKSLNNSSQAGEAYNSEDIAQVVQVLLPHLEGKFASREDVLSKDEVKLQSLLDRNPDLKGKEQEIKDLANLPHNKGKAYEDIIVNYGFTSKDKLDRARMSEPVGNRVQGESDADKIRKEDAVKKALSGVSTWIKK